MLENHNINNGDDYADLLVASMEEAFLSEPMDRDILNYWCVEIRKLCVEKYHNYIIGNEETFALNDVELENTYRLAIEKIIDESLQSLSEKGLLEISINDSGEILYGLNNKGKEESKKYNNE